MKELELDDTFFKDEIDYNNLEGNIYTQFAKTMAKNADIDLAKTPLVDLLTGYTKYRTLQFKIDKVNKLIDENKDQADWLHMPAWELQDILKEEE